MRRLNKVLAVVAVGILIPQWLTAETFPQVDQNFKETISSTEGLLSKAGSALGNGEPDSLIKGKSLAQTLIEGAKKAQKVLEQKAQETALRSQVDDLRGELDGLKSQTMLPDILMNNYLKQREQDGKQLNGLFQALNQAGQMASSAMINTRNLEQSCQDNVDFSQFQNLMQMMQSKPMEQLQSQGQKIIDERDEKQKEAKLKNLMELATKFKEANKRKSSPNELPKDVFGSFSKTSADQRIASLGATAKKYQNDVYSMRDELVDKMFGEFIPQLSKLKENDDRIHNLASYFAKNLEQYRKAALDSALTAHDQLLQNCVDTKDRLAANLKNASTKVTEFYGGDPNHVTTQYFVNGFNEINSNAKCNDVSQGIEQALGQNLQGMINNLTLIKDPKDLLQNAMTTMQAVAKAQNKISDEVRPLMNNCQYVAKAEKKSQKFLANVDKQIAAATQQAPAQGATRRAGAGSRRSSNVANSTNH